GFSNTNILLVFLSESLLIGVIGGTLGIFGGIGAGSVLLAAVSFGPPGAPTISPVFTPQDMISVWLLSVVLSAVAGLYPAWRAARLPPVVALRRE
ncbi:MAG: FtsX-like permease family protein, partial [Thaumarchaeota archaeon]|nr:FtsX-like permease family protein [Nitrososphaerota archaeon]